jgi:hypothetical protein
MKKLLLLTFMLSSAVAWAASSADTTIIEFNDKVSKNKIKVISNTNKTFEIPKILNLESVLQAIGVDSSERERALVLVSTKKDTKDTILVISREGQRIKIVTKENTFAKADSLIKGVQPTELQQEDQQNEPDEKREKKSRSEKKFFARSDFGLYLGINNFTHHTTSAPNKQSSLRTFQSRYVALSFRKNATLIKGKKADIAFSYGPEIAWYNFMLENSNVPIYEKDQVIFVSNIKPTEKSKLVMPYLNLPLMFNFGFKEDKFKIGFGGYAGYRIGGYVKEKYVSGGKNKTKGSYGLNNAVYGLTTEFGRKNGLTLFARYDLNTLFKSDQVNMADVQAFSVGFRL